jgi:hypothetical protein
VSADEGTVYRLHIFGEAKDALEVDPSDLPEGVTVLETADGRWTVEVALRAPSEEAAGEAAEAFAAEAEWEYGPSHGWDLTAVQS